MIQSLFCPLVLRGLLVNWRCRSCFQVGQTWTLARPTILFGPADVQLQFPARCACGAADEILVRMPVLLLGLLLVRLPNEAPTGGDLRLTELQIEPQPSMFLFRVEQKYRTVVERLLHTAQSGMPLYGIQMFRPASFTVPWREPDPDVPPEERDRRALGMTEDEWREFRRRAGLDDTGPDAPAEET